jgi:hypothetical protein
MPSILVIISAGVGPQKEHLSGPAEWQEAEKLSIVSSI